MVLPSPSAAVCARCNVRHPGRLACADVDLARRAREAPAISGLRMDAPTVTSLARDAVSSRVRRTPTSFGWAGRLACTIPPYVLLLALAHVMGLGTKLFVLTIGAPMLVFTLWWTKRVWDSPRRR